MSEPKDSPEGEPDPQNQPPPTLGEAMVYITAAPGHLFRRLRFHPVWPLALAVVGGPMLLLAALTFPAYHRLATQLDELLMAQTAGASPVSQVPETLPNALFFTLVMLLGGWLVGAGLVKLASLAFRGKTSFSRIYSVVAFASFPLIFRYLLIATSWSLQPLEVESFQGYLELTRVPFPWANLGFLAEVGTPLWHVLAQIDPFSVWMVGLVSLGLRLISELDQKKAFLASLSAALALLALLYAASAMLPQPAA